MIDTWKALLSGRKFNAALLALVCVAAAVVLRALDKLPADAFVPTLVALTTTIGVFMASQAHEDAAAKKAPPTTLNFSPSDVGDAVTPIPVESRHE